MAHPSGLLRRSHFLGAKIRALRRRSGMTLEDLSARCIEIDARRAPSVSYLSMIETGRRIPSEGLLELLAVVFQKDVGWFLDENVETEMAAPPAAAGEVGRVPLQPGFLFSRDLLETAIPEILSQTGTTGRQFAHVLIRSYQERHHNQFPDLERAAEAVGRRRFPMSVADLLRLTERHGLAVRWFDRKPIITRDASGREVRSLVRSFYDPPRTVYVNRALRREPARLKYDLAAHLGHRLLHDGDGMKSIHATGGALGGAPQPAGDAADPLGAQDILFAWRDFECSFFAGALLCPRLQFRRFVVRERHDVTTGRRIELTPAVVMRRITAVSPYRHWHYFDAYPPGYLRAVYRGNGIPLPWGSLRQVADACRQWAVFRMLERRRASRSLAQISVLLRHEEARLYACLALRARDAAGNPHVLSIGVDLVPALQSQRLDAAGIAAAVAAACQRGGGSSPVPAREAAAIAAVSRILNIAWIEEALRSEAAIICPHSAACPRRQPCPGRPASRGRARSLEQMRDEILGEARRS
jgi:transcriptional regulator with XRE-family HTH domain